MVWCQGREKAEEVKHVPSLTVEQTSETVIQAAKNSFGEWTGCGCVRLRGPAGVSQLKLVNEFASTYHLQLLINGVLRCVENAERREKPPRNETTLFLEPRGKRRRRMWNLVWERPPSDGRSLGDAKRRWVLNGDISEEAQQGQLLKTQHGPRSM